MLLFKLSRAMLFRYPIQDTFDLSNFQKSATLYLGMMPTIEMDEVKYIFTFPRETVTFKVLYDKNASEKWSVSIYDYSGMDTKIKDTISSILGANQFKSNEPAQIIDKAAILLKVFHKFGKLKAFI